MRRSDFLLLSGAALTGVFGATFLVIAERSLGLDAFFPVAQVWTIWSAAAATLMFSYQQWVIEKAPTSLAGGRNLLTRESLALAFFVSVCVTIVAAIWRQRLFDSTAVIWPIVAGLVPIGCALVGATRGIFASIDANLRLAGSIVGENAIRFAGGVGLAVIGASAESFAFVTLAGFAVTVVLLGTRRSEQRARPRTSVLGAAAAAGLLAHLLLVGSPLLVAASGAEPADVSRLFVVLTAFRIPHLFLQAITPRVAVHVASLVDEGRRAELGSLIVGVGFAGAATACLGAGVALLLGDLVVGAIFDIGGEVAPSTYAVLAFAATLSAAGQLLTVGLLSAGQKRLVVVGWGVALVGFVVVVFAASIDSVDEFAWGIVVAVSGAYAVLVCSGFRVQQAYSTI